MSPRKPKPGQDEHAKEHGEKVAEEAADAKAQQAAESASEAAEASEAAAEEEAEKATSEESAAEPAEEAAGEDASAESAAEPAGEGAEEDASAAGEAEQDAETPKRGRRRGSAETGAGARRRREAPKIDGEVVVRARAKYVRSAPRKARLVMDHIRGRPVEQARAVLAHTPRAVSADILKLLDSAVANAESNYELGADELRIVRAFVDEGPTIKRYRPRALGRATRINKRTSHMTIELTNGAS
jgi:large subunit ribosomal protein L22